MKILVIGSGGREHALAWRLAQSPRVEKVYVAPGNAGTAGTPNLENLAITDLNELADFAASNDIAFTVVRSPARQGCCQHLPRPRLKDLRTDQRSCPAGIF